MKMTTSHPRLLHVSGVVLECVLFAALLGVVCLHAAPNVKGGETAEAYSEPSGAASAATTCGTSFVCITDDRTGDHISYNCPSGTYTYTHCNPAFTLTGTGSVNTVNGIEMLADSQPDRRINAGLFLGQGTGRAVVYRIFAPGIIQTFTINQLIPFAPCGTCGVAASHR